MKKAIHLMRFLVDECTGIHPVNLVDPVQIQGHFFLSFSQIAYKKSIVSIFFLILSEKRNPSS
jgi:hypothetical protein